MKRFYVSGIVRPERAMIRLSEMVCQLLSDTGRPAMTIKFRVLNNQVTAIVDTDEQCVLTIRNQVRHFVETSLGVVGFLTGYSYELEISKIHDDEMTVNYVYGIGIPVLERRQKDIELSVALSSVWPLCFGSHGVFLRRCFIDLSLAMRHLDDTGFYCFRALESLRQYFGAKHALQDDRKQWEQMATALGVSKGDDAIVRKYGNAARHGVPLYLSDNERQEVFACTWRLIDRFLNYRLTEAGVPFRFDCDRPITPPSTEGIGQEVPSRE